MAEADVKIELKASIAGFIRDLKIAEKRLDRFAAAERRMALSSGASKMEKQYKDSFQKMKRHFDGFDSAVKKTGQVLSKVLMVAIKGTMLSLAAFGVVMLGIHASFGVGRWLMKGYAGAMKLVAQGGAAAAVALATVAAAMREQQAAMFAYKGKGASQLGGGVNQARAAMRALAADANLAVLGTEGLNKAYAAMSKSMSSSQISGSRNVLKSLMDFGSAGQDPAASAEKVGALIAVLNDAKKGIGDVQAAAKELGPEMEKAFKESGIKTKKQFQEMLLSGELAKKGGVFGQFDAVNGTLINQAKSFFSQIKVQFEQFGDKFLEPAKEAFFNIQKIIRKDLMRVYGELSVFGTGTFFEGLVTVVEKLSGFFVKLIREWLPQSRGQFEALGEWMSNFKRGWDLVLERMRPFIAGAKVIESIFSPIWKTLKEEGVAGMKDFNKNLQENAPAFEEFGERIAGLLKALFEFGRVFRQVFFDALPFINDILAGIKSAFGILTGFVGMFTKVLGGAGGLIALMVLTRGMKNSKGSFLGQASATSVQTMNVAQLNVAGGRGGLASGGTTGTGTTTGTTTGTRATTHNLGGVVTQGKPIGPPSPGSRGSGSFSAKGALVNAAKNQRANMMMAYNMPSVGPLGTSGFVDPAVLRKQMSNKGMSAYQQRKALFANQRQTAGYARVFGNAQSGQEGFNQRGSVKMGTALALSTLSQYAPEEMRGSLALGGAIGMINPLAGIAVGMGGAAINAKSPMKGAIAGAAAGAALGTLIPGVGTAIGAAVGAVGGTLMGAANRIKEEAKLARAAVDDGLGQVLNTIASNRFLIMAQNAENMKQSRNVKNVGAFEGFATEYTSGRARLSDANQAATRGLGARGSTTNVITKTLLLDATATILREIPVIGGAIGSGFDSAKGFFSGGNARTKKQKSAVNDIIAYIEASGGVLSDKQKRDMNKNRSATIKQFEKTEKAESKAGKMLDDTYKNRLDELEKISGKTRPELELLAKELGVDLYDSTVKFSDVVQKLGVAVEKTSDQMRQANTDIFVAGFDIFSKFVKAEEATKSYNENAENFRALAASPGGASNKDFAQYMIQYSADALDIAGGDPLSAFYDKTSQFGYEGRQGTALVKGGVFENVRNVFDDPKNRAMLEESNKITEAGLASTAAEQITAIFGGKGMTIDRYGLEQQIMAMAPAEQEKFLRDVQNKAYDPLGGRTGARGARRTNASLFGAGLSDYGLDASKLKIEETNTGKMDAVVTALANGIPEFTAAVTKFTQLSGEAFKSISTPEWLKDTGTASRNLSNKNGVLVAQTDTNSPRGMSIGDTTSSRLGQTMARHSAIDGALSGRRSITSAYRTYGLGSSNSDHVTGRAIDLVGDNLVSYRDAVNRGGGFAEFHGKGDTRHLHAVPGQGAMGDSVVPASLGMSSGKTVAVGGNSSYTININGSNASPEEIANRVMMKIKDEQRSRRERA